MKLTQRQLDVVKLLCQGLKRAEICRILRISVEAYDRRRDSILIANGITNDAQLGVMAERSQVVHVDQRNRIQDRVDERLDARRKTAGGSLPTGPQ